MSATVGAEIKKIAAALLSDPKILKTVVGIVLGILIVIIMPIAAILGIFSGGVEIDTGRLHEMIAEQQAVSAERWAEVENAMKSAGYDSLRIQEAQALFSFVLYGYASDSGFAEKLVGCFSAGQTDGQLIEAVNAAFGTKLSAKEFENVMDNIRNRRMSHENE